MVHILSEFQAPNSSDFCFYIPFVEETRCNLIIAKINKIEVYDITRTGLLLVDSLEFCDRIFAVGKIQPRGFSVSWLVVYTESDRLYVLSYMKDAGKFLILEDIEFDGRFIQRNLDTDPLMVTNDDNSCVVLHCREGYLQLLRVKPNAYELYEAQYSEQEPIRKKRKRLGGSNKSLFMKPVSIPLDPISIHSMAFMNTQLAVLYRTPELEVSMRYYSLDQDKGTANLTTQLPFIEAVSHMVPLAGKTGGLLICNENSQTYYPPPGKKLHSYDNTVTLKWDNASKSIHQFSPMMVISHCVIDENRILLVNTNGVAFMLFLDLQMEGDNIYIHKWKLLEIGYTTIASELIHINGDMFFASSSLSESILFRLLPSKPYIDVIQQIESSPPVLDIVSINDHGKNVIVTCQGCFESSELRIYTGDIQLKTSQQFNGLGNSQVFRVKFENLDYLVTFSHDTAEVYRISYNNGIPKEIAKSEVFDLGFLKNKLVLDIAVIDDAMKVVCEDGIYNGEGMIQTKSITQGKLIDEMVIYITQENVLFIDTIETSLRGEDITTFSVLKVGTRILILIGYLDGWIQLFSFMKKKVICVYEGSISCNSINSSLIKEKGAAIEFFVSDSHGNIHQFDERTADSSKTSRFGDSPLKIVSYKDLVIFTNGHSGFFIDMDKNKRHSLNMSQVSLESLEGEVPLLMGTNIRGDLQIVELDSTNLISSYRTIYEPCLFKRAIHIPNTDYLVVLGFKAIDTEKIDSEILLVDYRKATILHRYKFGAGYQIADLCSSSYIQRPEDDESELPEYIQENVKETLSQSFVAISTSQEKCLRLFQIVKNKIVPCSKEVGIPESVLSSPEKLEFENITNLHSNIFVLSGNCVVYVKLVHDYLEETYDFEFIYGVGDISNFIVNCKTYRNKTIVSGLLDTLKEYELVGVSAGNPHVRVKEINLVDKNFHSSFDVIDSEEGMKIAIADCSWNLTCGDSRINIGDQPNVVCKINMGEGEKKKVMPLFLVGTINGGIYLVSEIADGSSIETLEEKAVNDLMSSLKLSDSSKLTSLYRTYRSTKRLDGTRIGSNMVDMGVLSRWLEGNSKNKPNRKQEGLIMEIIDECRLI